MSSSPRSFLRLLFLTFTAGICFFLFSRLSKHDPGTIATHPSLQDRLDLVVSLQVLKQLLAERFVIDHWRSGRKYNAPAIDRLAECTLEGTCRPGETTVIILASFHFGNARAGHVSGEDIWAHSTMTAFEALNYTLLYAYGAMDALHIYQAIPELVPIIIFEGSSLDNCIKRNAETEAETDSDHSPGTWQAPDRIGCIRREGFEEGIPIWKTFAFHFWGGPATPMGSNWTLSPEDWGQWQKGRGNNYLGYSIEDRCTRTPVQKERLHRSLILAKLPDMLAGKDFAWPNMLAPVAAALPTNRDGTPFEFVSTAGRAAGQGGPDKIPEPGVRSMGKMPQTQWWDEGAKSKFMLGIGRPFLSPSPYDALCFGVPFINVIFGRDENNPQDKSRWNTMHDALIPIDPPYVYHVKQHEQEELVAALREAINHPIGRYIPPWMALESVRERHRILVETDWRSRAELYLAEKYKDKESPFMI